MALYEYECLCGRKFEAIVPMNQRDEVKCICGQKPQRKFNLFSFTFGWRFSDESYLPFHKKDELVRDI